MLTRIVSPTQTASGVIALPGSAIHVSIRQSSFMSNSSAGAVTPNTARKLEATCKECGVEDGHLTSCALFKMPPGVTHTTIVHSSTGSKPGNADKTGKQQKQELDAAENRRGAVPATTAVESDVVQQMARLLREQEKAFSTMLNISNEKFKAQLKAELKDELAREILGQTQKMVVRETERVENLISHLQARDQNEFDYVYQ